MEQQRQKAKSFRDLDVWNLGMDIVVEIYRITAKFPKEEMYGIITQLRRAAVSVPSNISEGFNRLHKGEYRQFLGISLGSCGELETQIEVSLRLGYIGAPERTIIIDKIDHEARMLRNLIKALQ